MTLTAKLVSVLCTLTAIPWALATSPRPKLPPQLAAIGPAIPFREKMGAQFIPCQEEKDCLEKLQNLDLNLAGKDSKNPETLVAEFVESPKKGIRVYKKKQN